MEEYEDALEVLEEGQLTDPESKLKFGEWISKCNKNLSGSKASLPFTSDC